MGITIYKLRSPALPPQIELWNTTCIHYGWFSWLYWHFWVNLVMHMPPSLCSMLQLCFWVQKKVLMIDLQKMSVESWKSYIVRSTITQISIVFMNDLVSKSGFPCCSFFQKWPDGCPQPYWYQNKPRKCFLVISVVRK